MPRERFANWMLWLTAASAILYGVALYVEIELVTRTVEVSCWQTIVGCALMTYLSYRCAKDVIWGHLFLFVNVVFSGALAVIAFIHLGAI